MTTRQCLATSLAAVALAVASPSIASPGDETTSPMVPEVMTAKRFDATGWTELGHTVVSTRKTGAAIALATEAGPYDQLVLVADGELDLSRVTVAVTGGRPLVRATRHHFTAAAPFVQVELPGNPRALRSVTLRYVAQGDGTATVTVYGRGSATASAPSATRKVDEAPTRLIGIQTETTKLPIVSAREGWTLLGARTVDGSHDADAIRVPTSTVGMYSQLAIVVAKGELDLASMRIRFAGGESADLSATSGLSVDDPIRLIALPDAAAGKVIRSIQLRYGAGRASGTPRVEIWAR